MTNTETIRFPIAFVNYLSTGVIGDLSDAVLAECSKSIQDVEAEFEMKMTPVKFENDFPITVDGKEIPSAFGYVTFEFN